MNDEKKSKNDKPIWEWDRGYKTFCCEEHVKQDVEESNKNKKKKISKSEIE